MFIKEITEESIGLPVTQGIDWATVPTRVAVRGVVQNAEWKIAVLQYSAYNGCALPGGGVDGQMLEEAFRREMREEIGYDVTNIVPLGVVREYRTYNDDAIINHTMIFTASVTGTQTQLKLSKDETSEGHTPVWMTADEAVSLLSKSLLDDATTYGGTFVMNRELVTIQEYLSWKQTETTQHPQIKELEDIAKNAQYSYIMLKSEFDSLVRRTENDSKEGKINQLVELAKKLTPIIDQLGQTVSHIPAELADNTWASGVKLVYENAIKTLATLGISLIPTIGEEPDMELHEPLSVEPTDDETLKGKITKEFQPGYVYEKDGIRKVITAAKVIVGN